MSSDDDTFIAFTEIGEVYLREDNKHYCLHIETGENLGVCYKDPESGWMLGEMGPTILNSDKYTRFNSADYIVYHVCETLLIDVESTQEGCLNHDTLGLILQKFCDLRDENKSLRNINKINQNHILALSTYHKPGPEPEPEPSDCWGQDCGGCGRQIGMYGECSPGCS